MHVEHLAHGNEIAGKELWNDGQVYAVDKRYASMLNSPRVNEVPIYQLPTAFEKESGFCEKIASHVAGAATELSKVFKDHPWWLICCPPNLTENRENLVGRHIAIKWLDERWYIAYVVEVQVRVFLVKVSKQ